MSQNVRTRYSWIVDQLIGIRSLEVQLSNALAAEGKQQVSIARRHMAELQLRLEVLDRALSAPAGMCEGSRSLLATTTKAGFIVECRSFKGKRVLFKVFAHFDGTARHPGWLGGDDSSVQKLAPQPAG